MKKITKTLLLLLLAVSLFPPININAARTDLMLNQVEKVAQVTGEDIDESTLINPNDTAGRFNVHATDLGVMWDATTDSDDPKIMIAFGDTYDGGWGGFGGGGALSGWRSNVLGVSRDQDLSDGLYIDSMIMDSEKENYAKEIIYSAKETHGYGDFTAIPTAGVTIGDRHFIHYMQVKRWGDPGQWDTNFSALVYSDDEGETWQPSDVEWAGDSHFAQVAFLKEEGYVYVFGTPSGRFGSLYLARVPEAELLNQDSYRYWDGKDWVVDELDAMPVVDAPVSELSVLYNAYYDRYLMMYLNEDKYSVVLRSATELTGEWSDEVVVVTGQEFPQLYGSYMHPWSMDSESIYFVMSEWGPYNVFLYRADLSVAE
ncbi:DUF4185 domain-containing protein [Fundicoccus culcitae]|uniref:DUF4185 domain-containing protein n=1 Tax=Fundicoccus culcitae TaxID=2969821 RepID=A0ABY5P4Z9_9LACT|nr:DUF4185 domain-containing protein [Fundicoccus culcitae]UUX33769.1 DUF4185 domain-containing protein [Fundicoccus culcitae]